MPTCGTLQAQEVAVDEGGELQGDDLAGVETTMSRLGRRGGRWLALLLAGLLVLGAVTWLLDELAFRGRASDLEAAVGERAAAVHLVRATGCDGQRRSGSAFVVSTPTGPALVTNRHVVEASDLVAVRSVTDGIAREVASLRLSDAADVAVLEVADPATLPAPLSIGGGVAEGDEVRLLGFPAARPWTTAGTVAAVGRDRLALDLRVAPGASGSPVVDADAVVVAQVFARTPEGTGVATPAGLLADAIRDAAPAPLGCD
jgi:S1-C subfamily serine protease